MANFSYTDERVRDYAVQLLQNYAGKFAKDKQAEAAADFMEVLAKADTIDGKPGVISRDDLDALSDAFEGNSAHAITVTDKAKLSSNLDLLRPKYQAKIGIMTSPLSPPSKQCKQ